MNPYLYPPADAALSSLRDAAIYPYLNRADYAPTIYPPAAQIVFRLVTSISEALSPGEKARNPGAKAHETTTMRRTNRLPIRRVRRLSPRFLRAMIVEWSFPMLHIDKALPHL